MGILPAWCLIVCQKGLSQCWTQGWSQSHPLLFACNDICWNRTLNLLSNFPDVLLNKTIYTVTKKVFRRGRKVISRDFWRIWQKIQCSISTDIITGKRMVYPWDYPWVQHWLTLFWHTTRTSGWKNRLLQSSTLGMWKASFLFSDQVTTSPSLLSTFRRNIPTSGSPMNWKLKTLSFLDVKVFKEADKFSRTIHCKSRFSRVYSNFWQFMPDRYKRGLVSSLFTKMLENLGSSFQRKNILANLLTHRSTIFSIDYTHTVPEKELMITFSWNYILEDEVTSKSFSIQTENFPLTFSSRTDSQNLYCLV